MSDAIRSIMSECEGHRFGQSGYDITLDHIYECAEVAAAELADAERRADEGRRKFSALFEIHRQVARERDEARAALARDEQPEWERRLTSGELDDDDETRRPHAGGSVMGAESSDLPPHDADCESCNRDYSMPIEAIGAYCDEGSHPVLDIAHLHNQNGRSVCARHLRAAQ